MKTTMGKLVARALGLCVALAALAAATLPAGAADAPGRKPSLKEEAATKVLFIGNSFTYYNTCWEMFKGLAALRGKAVTVKAATNGGKDLVFQSTAANVLQAIQADVYDVVVIQDKVGSDFRKERLLEGCAAIVPIIKKSSPNARLVFYEPWPTRSQLVAKMALFTESYLAAARQYGAALAPAGEGFYALYVNDHLDYYCRDDRHPQPLGTFNSALTIFYALFPDAPFAEFTEAQHAELNALINRCVAHAQEGQRDSYPLDVLNKINRYAYQFAHAMIPAVMGNEAYVSVANGGAAPAPAAKTPPDKP